MQGLQLNMHTRLSEELVRFCRIFIAIQCCKKYKKMKHET